MRRIIVSEMLSIDGYFAGSDGNIDWHVTDDEFDQFALELLGHVDAILFGRVTFELFETYWPTAAQDPATSENDKQIARAINSADKIVFSHTPIETQWEGVRSWSAFDATAVSELKQRPGADIVVYGSGTIVRQLADAGLIDEYVLIVAPVLLGEGEALFEGIAPRSSLRLAEARPLGSSGNVLLRYLP